MSNIGKSIEHLCDSIAKNSDAIFVFLIVQVQAMGCLNSWHFNLFRVKWESRLEDLCDHKNDEDVWEKERQEV